MTTTVKYIYLHTLLRGSPNIITINAFTMAKLREYTCPECGYDIFSSKDGSMTLMHGDVEQYYSCRHCKDIVRIPEDAKNPKCPECGNTDGLEKWNPIDGHCPQCGAKKLKEGDIEMLVD